MDYKGLKKRGGGSLKEIISAIVCFENSSSGKSCDLFDGTSSTPTFSSNYPHNRGSLGFYEGKPTTVGSEYSAGAKKVETLTESGWVSLSDHPE